MILMQTPIIKNKMNVGLPLVSTSYHYVSVEEISDFNLSMDETIFFFASRKEEKFRK